MPPNGNVQATIDGDIEGQVAVGNYILQIGDVNGGVVNVAPQTQIQNYTRRTEAVNLRPRPFTALLDRENETAAVKSALGTFTPVFLYGPPGIGKTSLLRSLSHISEANQFRDGVVYLSVSGLGLSDVLQSLFDVFHESQLNFKPTDTEIRIAMQGVHALIFLDDINLSRDDTAALLDALPDCMFVLAGLERNIWGEGQPIALSGLPVADALDLFVLELDRALDEREQSEVREICILLGSHPLRVIQSASIVREDKASIPDIWAQLQQAPDEGVIDTSLETSTDTQRKLVAIMAAAGGVAVPVEHLRSISQSDVVVKDLQELVSLGVVQTDGSRFQLAGEVSETVSKLWDLTSWEDRLIEFLVEWLVKKPAQNLLDESLDLLVEAIHKAEEKNRWLVVVKIGRGFERVLVLRKRWQTWLNILNLILKAARALGDRKVEGWALHQIGTRAACLGYNESARGFLTQALNIRQAIGDQAGLAVTQNNLHVFFNIPLPPNTGRLGCRRCLTCGAVGAGIAVVATFVIAGAFLLFRGSGTVPPPTSSPIPEKTVTAVISPTITNTITETPIFTDTPTTTTTSSVTPSRTNTPTNTATNTPTVTPSRTPTSTFTPSPTPDTVGPPAPNAVSPKDDINLSCPNTPLYLSWIKVNDPSGIEDYNIELLASTNGSNWSWFWLLTASGNAVQYNVTSEYNGSCDFYSYYRWRIKANDNAGNNGTWSNWYNFHTLPVVD